MTELRIKVPVDAWVNVASPTTNRQYYEELKCNTEDLVGDIKHVKRFIECEIFFLARNRFQEANERTFNGVKKFRHQPTLFEPADNTKFNEGITDIEKELRIIEDPISTLNESDPNKVFPIVKSLTKITTIGNDIILTVEGRYLAWQSQSLLVQA